jgi:hypothetical protein
LDLARAGEARHFVAWLGASAGLRGGSLSDLAVAAEAVLTDVFLSTEGGVLEVRSEVTGEQLRITVGHPGSKSAGCPTSKASCAGSSTTTRFLRRGSSS